jgi:hypothetical protein
MIFTERPENRQIAKSLGIEDCFFGTADISTHEFTIKDTWCKEEKKEVCLKSIGAAHLVPHFTCDKRCWETKAHLPFGADLRHYLEVQTCQVCMEPLNTRFWR